MSTESLLNNELITIPKKTVCHNLKFRGDGFGIMLRSVLGSQVLRVSVEYSPNEHQTEGFKIWGFGKMRGTLFAQYGLCILGSVYWGLPVWGNYPTTIWVWGSAA